MNHTFLNNEVKDRVVVVSSLNKALHDFPALAEQAGFKAARWHMILLKPNVCGMYPPALALLRAIIQYVTPYAKALVIGETPSAMNDPTERFQSLGITAMARAQGVVTRDLMDDPIIQKRVPKPHTLTRIPLPSTVMDADLLVNCPGVGTHGNTLLTCALKNCPGVGTHGNTLLTCALKNLFGLIAERHKFSRLHPKGVSEVVADLFQIVKPGLNVVDCGKKVLVGTDALSVDVVACDFVSLSPLKVRHLVLAARDLGFELRDLRIRRIEL
ncbi:hypothetical protein AC480_06185 [miscellaneous Crenarchaeota group archaeon SMTZ1-55]|nr:MAG: hypothetical protein AC480_06185 [miscellaneous Crenarchaeota group archaeon SMTZ1-55]